MRTVQCVRVTTYFVLIGYRHCSRLDRLVLNTFSSNGTVHTSVCGLQFNSLQFSSCAVNENLGKTSRPLPKSRPELRTINNNNNNNNNNHDNVYGAVIMTKAYSLWCVKFFVLK